MSEFRGWLQEKIVRLDGKRERRIIALGAMALFLAILFGPWMLRAVDAVANPVGPMVRDIDTTRVSNPITLQAAASDSETYASDGSPSGATSVTRFAELVSVALTTADGNSVTASGVQTSFDAASAVFHAESGTAYSQDFPAARGADGVWRTTFEVPPGKSYVVKLIILSSDGLQVKSSTRQLEVPAAASPLSPPAPTVAPSLSILFPSPDAPQTGPVSLAARISSASAVGVIFEIRDESGGIRSLQASPTDDSGVWSFLFDDEPGGYVLSVRASFDNGFVQDFYEQRGFRILADAEPSAATTASMASTLDL